jgi:OFA family oxalate/formate antiporter-like MFS transporter
MKMMGNIRNKAWLVLVAAVLFNFLAGLLYIWSIISKAMMTEFNWTSSQASLPYTVGTGCLCYCHGAVR